VVDSLTKSTDERVEHDICFGSGLPRIGRPCDVEGSAVETAQCDVHQRLDGNAREKRLDDGCEHAAEHGQLVVLDPTVPDVLGEHGDAVEDDDPAELRFQARVQKLREARTDPGPRLVPATTTRDAISACTTS
jgi:hypothetical protein